MSLQERIVGVGWGMPNGVRTALNHCMSHRVRKPHGREQAGGHGVAGISIYRGIWNRSTNKTPKGEHGRWRSPFDLATRGLTSGHRLANHSAAAGLVNLIVPGCDCRCPLLQ